jgi:hypothetical protein
MGEGSGERVKSMTAASCDAEPLSRRAARADLSHKGRGRAEAESRHSQPLKMANKAAL